MKPTATEIPALLNAGPRWMVDLGPTPSERYYGTAPDEETAIRLAQEEHERRQSEATR